LGRLRLKLVCPAWVNLPVDVAVRADGAKDKVFVVLKLLLLNALPAAGRAGPGCMASLADHLLAVEVALEGVGQVGKLMIMFKTLSTLLLTARQIS